MNDRVNYGRGIGHITDVSLQYTLPKLLAKLSHCNTVFPTSHTRTCKGAPSLQMLTQRGCFEVEASER